MVSGLLRYLWDTARMPLRVGSLFSGIGGLELGFERAGMQTVFQVEIDPYAQRVLAKHWPHVPRFSDVREVGAHNLPECDVLCGGFPCQDISQAGNRLGIDEGERSGLWREFARLIRELRPRYVVMENVRALLHPLVNDEGAVVAPSPAARVLGDLAACGYDTEWDCLPASAFGAPHQRDRFYGVAYANGQGRTKRPQVFACCPREGWPRQDCGGSVSRGRSGRDRLFPPPGIQRMVDGVPSRVDASRLKAVGNAVSPVVAEFVGRCIVAHAGLLT